MKPKLNPSQSERSVKTRLATQNGPYDRTYVLIHSTAGYEPAGSMCRWTDEKWTVGHTESSGTFHGRSFSTEAKAREYFALIVSNI